MPHDTIIDLLRDTFDVTAASYNWVENLNPADQRLTARSHEGITIKPLDTLDPIAEEIAAWRQGRNAGRHALVTWHMTVGGPLPYTTERVPTRIVSVRERQPQLQMNSAASTSWRSTCASAARTTAAMSSTGPTPTSAMTTSLSRRRSSGW